jgi:hypothetical protein
MALLPLQRLLKPPFWTFYAAVSAVFLVLGAWAGASFAKWPSIQTMLTEEEAGQNATLTDTGQRNLLIIGVDSLDREDPRLESLWLLLYLPGRSPVTCMPLYPGVSRAGSLEENPFVQAFGLDRSGKPEPAFFDRLRHEQVWWSGYVLLDEYALAAFIDHLGGLEMDGRRMDGVQALQGIPQPWQDRAGALGGQVALLRSICRRAGARMPEQVELAGYLEQTNRHLLADIDLELEIQEWLGAAGPQPALECEFPLLDLP